MKKEGIDTVDGLRYLGTPVGTDVFKSEWLEQKFSIVEKMLKNLIYIAKPKPHEAFIVYTKAVKAKLNHISITLNPSTLQGSAMERVDIHIRKLIEEWTGSQYLTEHVLAEMALPFSHGGIGVSSNGQEYREHHMRSHGC